MDRFEKLSLLGKGVKGKAWLVKDRSSGELLTLKQIKCEYRRDYDDALEEAQVLARLDHVNIIQYVSRNMFKYLCQRRLSTFLFVLQPVN
jgi:serine/threonine protein kinase